MPEHITRLIGFALTSTIGSFAADTTKAERGEALTAFNAQLDAFQAAAASYQTGGCFLICCHGRSFGSLSRCAQHQWWHELHQFQR